MKIVSQQQRGVGSNPVFATLLMLVGVLLLSVMFVYWRMPPEPVYQGATVCEWMSRQAPDFKFGMGTQAVVIAVSSEGRVSCQVGNSISKVSTAARQTDETQEALIEMGASEVIPRLLTMLRAPDSAIRDYAAILLEKQNAIKLRLARATILHARGLVGFSLLGTNSAVSIPELERMIHDDATGSLPCQALVLIGGDEATGVLHKCVKGSDSKIESRVPNSLRIWIPDSKKPLMGSLVGVLNRDDRGYHLSAIRTLSEIGAPGKGSAIDRSVSGFRT